MSKSKSRSSGFHTERPREKAFVVHVSTYQGRQQSAVDVKLSDKAKLAEAVNLASAIWLDVIFSESFNLDKLRPSTLIGKGACERIADEIELQKPDVVIINHALSPVQQRNLEKEWGVKVIDRTGLILEIFGERAQTKEGRIQVDLACLQYQRTRLVKAWTHLERQRGGAGFMGGPGETQLEIDRRIVDDKIAKLKIDLDKVKKRRDLHRDNRAKVPFPVVALVGYTNAGKSTLFNHMTGAEVLAEDLLFATLDPTMRKMDIPNGQSFILADTVGFISDLPTHLVAAFRATLEQLEYADVVLHVRDVSSSAFSSEGADVRSVMKDLGIEYEEDDRIVEVWNKIDLVDGQLLDDLMLDEAAMGYRKVCVSALEEINFDELIGAVTDVMNRKRMDVEYSIPFTEGQAMAWLKAKAEVLSEEVDADSSSMLVSVRIEPADVGKFKSRFGYEPLG